MYYTLDNMPPSYSHGGYPDQQYQQYPQYQQEFGEMPQEPGAGSNAWDAGRDTIAQVNPIVGAFHQLGKMGEQVAEPMIDKEDPHGSAKSQVGTALKFTMDPFGSNMDVLENKDLSGGEKFSSIASSVLTGGWGGDDWFGLVKKKDKKTAPTLNTSIQTDFSSNQDGFGTQMRGFGPNNMSYGEMFAKGGVLPNDFNRQHPQAEYEVEGGEVIYHPNDKPIALNNGGLSENSEDFSKVTGNKHSAAQGGPQMKGGKDGYVYSDQLKVPKDLYKSLKDLL